MHIIDGFRRLSGTDFLPCAVGIGVFDGVHQGHRALISQVVALARSQNLQAVAYTFDPHPARLFAADRAPKLIEPLACRLERLAALGIEVAIVEPFDAAFAAHTADAFCQRILVDTLSARHVVVGAGFAFGRKQQGSVAFLQAAGAKASFDTHPVSHVQALGHDVSSTQVRACIAGGDVAQARVLLGRPYMLVGRVVRGAHRGGTQLGIPTANLSADNELPPKPGVYRGFAQGVFGREPCVINIGTNPTFETGDAVKIEAHLFAYTGPAFYDTPLRLHLEAPLRPERRFDGIAALKAQIAQDIAQARKAATS